MAQRKQAAQSALQSTAVNVGKVSDALVKATDGLAKQIEVVAGLPAIAQEQLELIQEREEKLESLGDQFEAEYRKGAAELALRVSENEDEVVNELLSARGKVAVEQGTVPALEAEIQRIKDEQEATIKAEVGREKGILESRQKAELDRLELTHKAERAQDAATIASQTTRITELVAERDEAKALISEAMNNTVKVAEAAGQAKTTVNTAR
ncbi:hypothetical protein [Pseudoalteromonas phage J2-1_QLiu-2017]|nr:hypothetical protein [Pseudoalteromonas phage J2-1_QLiu-2017]